MYKPSRNVTTEAAAMAGYLAAGVTVLLAAKRTGNIDADGKHASPYAQIVATLTSLTVAHLVRLFTRKEGIKS